MMAEEAFLRTRFGDVFEQWAAATPAFIPKFHAGSPSSSVLLADGAATRIQTHFSYHCRFFPAGRDWRFHRRKTSQIDVRWFAIFVAGFVIFATLRTSRNARIY